MRSVAVGRVLIRYQPEREPLVSEAVGWTCAAMGLLAPYILVIYAFWVSDDASQRAHIVVVGCEAVALSLLCLVAMAACYLLGVDAGLRRREPGDVPGLAFDNGHAAPLAR